MQAIGPATFNVPNGTVLLVGVSYEGAGQTDLDTSRGRTAPKVFTYAMLKAGGLWYVTGSGKVPVAAGWGAVERWLSRDGRVVEWVKTSQGWNHAYIRPVDVPDPYRATSQS